MAGKKLEYYILECPCCDTDITKVLEDITSNIIVCPNCQKELNLYTVFGYNMWLVENGKAKKVSKKPIKTYSRKKDFDDSNDYVENNYIDNMDCNISNLQLLLSQNADICATQYNYLIKKGFTRLEAIDIVLKLIEQGFIL